MIWPTAVGVDRPVLPNVHLPFHLTGTRVVCNAAPEGDVLDGLNSAAKINTNYSTSMRKCRANRDWSIPDDSGLRPDLSSATTAFSYSTPQTKTMAE